MTPRRAGLVLVGLALLAGGCTAKAKVDFNRAEPPPPEPARAADEVPIAQSEPAMTPEETLKLLEAELGLASCSGRPNLRKAVLATNVCGGTATWDELQELHTICTAQHDGECHSLSHTALRTWSSESSLREPARAAVCEVRSKEALLAAACHDQATQETLTDLIRRCRRNDRTCTSIARAALQKKNPLLAKKFR